MNTRKNIFWRNDMPKNPAGESFANVHLLVGDTSGTITTFQNLAKELRKTFPDVKDEEIRCGSVRKSRSVQGFSMVAMDMHIPEGEYPGWTQHEDAVPEYYW